MIKVKLLKTSVSRATSTSGRSNTLLTRSESAKMTSTTTGRSLNRTEHLYPPGPYPIPFVWNRFVPAYESKNYGAQTIIMQWDSKYAERVEQISKKRANNRYSNYVDPFELVRVARKLKSKGEASIRFGAEKRGHGYSGERGDFCLVGGVIKSKQLSLFYRSIEMIGGFAYDLTLVGRLGQYFDRRWDTVTIYTCKAFTFALRGNSNEKLFPRLQGIFRE